MQANGSDRRLKIAGSALLGVFATCTETALLVPPETGSRAMAALERHLGLAPLKTTVAGSSVLGSLVCGNSHGFVITPHASDEEMERLSSLGRRARLPGKISAAGNVILANDTAAIVHAGLSDRACESISRTLGVDVRRGTIGGLKTVGMTSVATNRGILVHPRISEAELAGRELTDDDLLFIRDIGERLDEALLGVDERSKKTTIVADVHTDPNTDMALEEAVGYVRMIVIACDRPDGGVFLAAGPTYSYYEFKQPLSERLTDEGWREILVDDPPQDPEWTASFADFLPCSVLMAAFEEKEIDGEDADEGTEGDAVNEVGPEGDLGAKTARSAVIRLEEFEVRIGWNLLEGWYADCTIALRNSGDAEGTADVVLEDGEGKLLAELKIPVPPNSTVTERAKVDISGRGQEVNSKLVA